MWRYKVFVLSREHVVNVSPNVSGVVALSLSQHPAKFGIHKPYESGDNDVCNASLNFNSSSNAEVSLPKFPNGPK